MDFHRFLMQITLFATILAATEADVSQPKPGCNQTCGSLSIPFPFGTTPECYLDDSFLVTCNTSFNPPKPFLRKSDSPVLSITLDGHMRISVPVASDCYNKSGMRVNNNTRTSLNLKSFFISSTLNKFTAVGCETLALASGVRGENYSTGCLSLCSRLETVTNGTCSGVGCCQTDLPKGARDFSASVGSIRNHSAVLDFNPCGYAFVIEKDSFNFTTSDLKDLQKRESSPVVLDWAVGNKTCLEARKNLSSYACRASLSECHDSGNGPGYLCRCPMGYGGNPYIIDGCQDVNECEVSNPCNGICTNSIGSFSCSCPKGYEGDGLKDGKGCRIQTKMSRTTLLVIALGVTIGLLVVLLISFWLYWMRRKMSIKKLRQEFFQQNGGLLLQQQLAKHEMSVDKGRIFTSEDLKKATNNYEESGIIGQGGFGTVYKGLLTDNTVVAIKKSKVSDKSQIEQFINEMVVLTQVNHRNVVKLIGCCLETEVPLLVYEFVNNGTLSHHIHGETRAPILTWEKRLNIASETAGAIAYLHSATSVPIIHRDIKSTNILLEDNYTAKVADFGASRLVPQDYSQLATLVQGTFGYMDPEYFHSSQLTEKSDVYSFGVVLAELITGEEALSFTRPDKDRNLANCFISAMKDNRLIQIVDPRIVNDASLVQIEKVAELTWRCLRMKSEDRPTMKEVVMELDGLRMVKKHPWKDEDVHPEETKLLLYHDVNSDVYYDRYGNIDCTTSVGYDSLMNHQMMEPLDDGR